ncbi:transposable element Tcb1 transposase [Trichonephila clavipes]|nr:transposable element Tcb1 transposase [Trichonephila clavipes]
MFLWGYVKSLVYADKPQTLDHLEDNIRRVIADIRPQMLQKVIENWTSRLDYIRASRGSPMPEIILKIYVLHPSQCTTSREDRQIVRMAVTDRSVTSRTIEEHFESVTHHSVSASIIRRRLQQSGLSARRPLLGLPLTQNHRRLRRQWCDERRMFFVNRQIELLPQPARSPDLSPIENMWSMVGQLLTQITPPAATPDQLWQRGEATWSSVHQEHIQSLFELMPRRVTAVISNNGGYSGY